MKYFTARIIDDHRTISHGLYYTFWNGKSVIQFFLILNILKFIINRFTNYLAENEQIHFFFVF